MKTKFKILSIDAWGGTERGSWEWNNWHTIGEIEAIPDTNRKILKLLREEGFLSRGSIGAVEIDDDQYNLVICDRSNHEPLIAIEYGALQ